MKGKRQRYGCLVIITAWQINHCYGLQNLTMVLNVEQYVVSLIRDSFSWQTTPLVSQLIIKSKPVITSFSNYKIVHNWYFFDNYLN